VATDALAAQLQAQAALSSWRDGRSARISQGFYTSQAWEWHRP
jgi:hypothetical protein